jgi:ABC-type multidrug transport system fused ATPase/permease subunit
MNTIMIGMLAAILFVPVTAYASISSTNTTNTIDQSAITTEISDFGTQMDRMIQFSNGCTVLQSNPGALEECFSVISEFNDYMNQLRNNHNATIDKYAEAGLEEEEVQSGGTFDWEVSP